MLTAVGAEIMGIFIIASTFATLSVRLALTLLKFGLLLPMRMTAWTDTVPVREAIRSHASRGINFFPGNSGNNKVCPRALKLTSFARNVIPQALERLGIHCHG